MSQVTLGDQEIIKSREMWGGSIVDVEIVMTS
jgi:hypothetical protein